MPATRTGPSPYADPEYRAARTWLTLHPNTECWHPGCTAPATTIDHIPAIAEHTHLRGTRCCRLQPACAPCNLGHGAALGNRLREPHTEQWW